MVFAASQGFGAAKARERLLGRLGSRTPVEGFTSEKRPSESAESTGKTHEPPVLAHDGVSPARDISCGVLRVTISLKSSGRPTTTCRDL